MSITLSLTKTVQVVEHETITHHEMLRRLHDRILAYGPEHFDMNTWAAVPSQADYDDSPAHLDLVQIVTQDVNFGHCGTTGCFAGHMMGWVRDNGLKDMVGHFNSDDYYRVDPDKLQRLMGVSVGSFSSSYHEWHYLTRSAYVTTLAIDTEGAYYTEPRSWGDEDDDQNIPVTWETIAEDTPMDHWSVVHDGIVESWGDWRKGVQQHAEWVAILTYLTYVAEVSGYLYVNGKAWDGTWFKPTHVSQADVDRIIASPAFSTHADERQASMPDPDLDRLLAEEEAIHAALKADITPTNTNTEGE